MLSWDEHTREEPTWHIRRDEKSWGEKSSDEIKWEECESEVCSWNKVSQSVELQGGCAQVLFLDNNSAASSRAKHAGTGLRGARRTQGL